MTGDTGRGGRPGARRAVLAAVSAALMATALPATAAAAESVPRWTAQRMTGSVGSMHVVTGTNNRGQVIGWGVTPDAEWRSFLWDGERLTAPPTLPDGSEPQFQAINDRGQVAGYDKLADGSRRAVLWSADGRPRALGATGIVGVQDLNERGQVLIDRRPHQRDLLWDGERLRTLTAPGPDEAAAPTQGYQLNDRGQVLANTYPRLTPAPQPHPERTFVWRDGASSWVPTPPGTGEEAVVLPAGFTERGLVAAEVSDPSDPSGHHPYLAWRGKVTPLPPLPGTGYPALSRRQDSVNERGDTVGTVYDPQADKLRAVLWSHGRPRELGGGSGGDNRAVVLNERGDVAGWSVTARGVPHAVLWRDGRMHVLGTPEGHVSSRAAFVTDRGEVSGTATSERGDVYAFLWRRR
ncbi:hypothetical protein [Streptomyces smyrnaeus]|uniref:hypothetical protein n=1 Tax=Streptomyces smyrnaeus TaxID=1387713 RepID=UPI0036A6A722